MMPAVEPDCTMPPSSAPRPTMASPYATAHSESSLITFRFPCRSRIDFLEGRCKAILAKSSIFASVAPPPVSMIPAGRRPLLSIRFRWSLIRSKMSARRAMMISSSFLFENANSEFFPVLIASASSRLTLSPSATLFVISFEPNGKS